MNTDKWIGRSYVLSMLFLMSAMIMALFAFLLHIPIGGVYGAIVGILVMLGGVAVISLLICMVINEFS